MGDPAEPQYDERSEATALDAPATSRRSVLLGGGASVGIAMIVLPSSTAAASDAFGSTPLTQAGSMDTPAELAAVAGDTRVALTWSSVTGASAYQVQYREFGSSDWLVDRITDQTSLTVSGLTNGTQYEFRVIASDGTPSNVSAPTSSVSETPQLTAPSTPVGVTAGPGEPGQLVVSWSAGSTGGEVASYTVEYSTTPNDAESWTSVTGITATTTTITGLVNNTEYSVRVTAVNAAGSSAASSIVTGTPVASLSTTVASPEPAPPVLSATTFVGYASGAETLRVEIVTDKAELEGGVNVNANRRYFRELNGGAEVEVPEFFTLDVPDQASSTIVVRKYDPYTDGNARTLIGTSTVIVERRTASYTSGQAYTLTNSSTDSRIGGLRVTAIGGSGGRGGDDGSRTGGAPSQPGRVDAIIGSQATPIGSGVAIVFAAGAGGASGTTGGSGGTGGSNAWSDANSTTDYRGGNGAADGPRGASGTGGGGGAASIVRVGDTVALVAGGAGGGGGCRGDGWERGRR
jgi:hypothetical protein